MASTVDTTKNVAASAVDKSASFLGNAKGTAKYSIVSIHRIFSDNSKLILFIVDSVASTVSSTVDTTKSVAGSVFEKGTAFVGGAKGTFLCYLIIFTSL